MFWRMKAAGRRRVQGCQVERQEIPLLNTPSNESGELASDRGAQNPMSKRPPVCSTGPQVAESQGWRFVDPAKAPTGEFARTQGTQRRERHAPRRPIEGVAAGSARVHTCGPGGLGRPVRPQDDWCPTHSKRGALVSLPSSPPPGACPAPCASSESLSPRPILLS